jgi:phytanoyl-CoA hydroxylase
MLSDRETEQYRTDGYLAIEGILEPRELAELRKVTEEFVEKSRAVTENDDVYDLEPGHSADAPKLRRLKSPNRHHPVYDRALRNNRILDIVEQLIGEGVHSNGQKLNIKSAEVGSPVEWHQDWAFYPHTNDDLLAVGIYLDDATLDNGCLMVVPRSHTGPVLDHHQDGHFVGAVTEPGFDPSGAAPILVKAGGISIHHARLLHGSAPNTSGNPRRLLLFQYVANDAWPLVPVPSGWEKYTESIVRGKPTRRPRLAPVPVAIPLPEPRHGGSIYEIQRDLKKPVFAQASR